MKDLPIELYLVGGIAALLLVIFILVRFGKAIVKVVLVVAGLAVAGVFGLALLQQSNATREAAKVAQITSTGQAGVSVGVVILAILVVLLAAVFLGLAGYCFLRWKLAERSGSWRRPPVPFLGRGARLPAGQEPLIYVVEAPAEYYDPVPVEWEQDGGPWDANDWLF